MFDAAVAQLSGFASALLWFFWIHYFAVQYSTRTAFSSPSHTASDSHVHVAVRASCSRVGRSIQWV